jgi:hypothetical protein
MTEGEDDERDACDLEPGWHLSECKEADDHRGGWWQGQ